MLDKSTLCEGPAVVRGISLPAGIDAALKEQAQREDRPVSWVVRRAITAYLVKQADGETGDEEVSAASVG